MLNPIQVKPFLLHEESIIRRFAASYLSRGMIYDRDIMPLLIKAYRMEKNKAFAGYIAMYMKDFPQDSETIGHLYRLARNVAKDRFHFEGALAYADIELIQSSPKKIIFSIVDFSEVFKRRVELSSQSTQNLWEQLIEMCCTAKNDYEHFDFSIVKMLSTELSGRTDVPTDKIEGWFKTFSSKEPDFDEVFMCVLAGELKLIQYADHILESLQYNWDYINEEAVHALIKMHSPYVVKQIAEMYPKQNDHFQLFSIDVLRNTKISEAEESIIELFHNTKDMSCKSNLFFGLCSLVSAKALELGTSMLSEGYDNMIDSLEKNLYRISIMHNLNPPQLAQWKEIADKNDSRIEHMEDLLRD